MKKIIFFAVFIMSFVFLASSVAFAEYRVQTNCPNISQNLWYGNYFNNGQQVRELQNFLWQYYGVTGQYNATGYYGQITKSFVARFQRDMGISMTGGVGPLTRAAIKNICYNGNNWNNGNGGYNNNNIPNNCKVWYDGCNTCSASYQGGPYACTMMACIQQFVGGQAYCKEYFNSSNYYVTPSISYFSGPTTLKTNEKGTWRVSANISDNSQLTYKITWGDESVYPLWMSARPADYMIYTQNTTFEHTYSSAGTYTVTVEVKSTNGQTAKTTSTVVVTNNYYTSCYNLNQSYVEGDKLTCLNGNVCLTDAYYVCRSGSWKVESSNSAVCSSDAMQCPNGQWVGRTGPKCQFICN